MNEHATRLEAAVLAKYSCHAFRAAAFTGRTCSMRQQYTNWKQQHSAIRANEGKKCDHSHSKASDDSKDS